MSESSFSVPNGHAEQLEHSQPPSEIESTLARLSAYRNVRGVMIISRSSGLSGPSGGVVQHNGSVFEGDSGKKYARVVEGLVRSVSAAVTEVDEGVRFRSILSVDTGTSIECIGVYCTKRKRTGLISRMSSNSCVYGRSDTSLSSLLVGLHQRRAAL